MKLFFFNMVVVMASSISLGTKQYGSGFSSATGFASGSVFSTGGMKFGKKLNV